MIFMLPLAERHHQAEQVRARAERVGGVVADHQRDAVALRLCSTAFITKVMMSGIDRVHLRVELEAEDAVAQIEDRRARVAFDLAAGGADSRPARARAGRSGSA